MSSSVSTMRAWFFACLHFLGCLVLAVGCASDDSPTQLATPAGRLGLALRGASASGQVYQLRQATFVIEGQSTGHHVTVSTQEDPQRTSIDLEVPADTYSVWLQPGYEIVRVEAVTSGAEFARLAKRNPALRSSLAIGRDSRIAFDPRRAPDRAGAPQYASSPSDGGLELAEDEGQDAGSPQFRLVSANPAFAEVEPFGFAAVRFRFQVEGELVETQPGVLSIGIEIEEVDVTCDDEFEPNNEPEQAAWVNGPFSASICDDDEDWYRFEAPVAAGEPFEVNVRFSQARGDIDAVLLDAQSGHVVASGASTSDDETMVALSSGGDYLLFVYLYGGGHTTYQVEFSASSVEQSNCCEASPYPGCEVETITSCLCELDPYCCEVEYDEQCVLVALTQCDAQCEGQADCCEATSAPGCSLPEVQRCVCQTDIACCSSGYDETCARQAQAECGLQCGEPPAAASNCCEATPEPGCLQESVEACVCAIDARCCSESFDANCVGLAAHCGASCPAPAAPQSCCETALTAGCATAAIEACVCEIDAFCCGGEYDATCVQIANEACGAACAPSDESDAGVSAPIPTPLPWDGSAE